MTTSATSPAVTPTAHRTMFSRELRHEIEVDTPAERVWQALTDTTDYKLDRP